MSEIEAHPDNHSTSLTLLERLWSNDGVAWKRLTVLYGPTVYGWCRAAGLQPEDAADITQNVFQAVYTGFNRFRKDRPGDRFRDWLWTVTRHRIIDHLRKLRSAPVGVGGSEAHMQWQQLQEPPLSTDGDSSAEESETAQLVRRALELVRTEFEPRTWQACLRTTVEGHAVADVASELGMSPGAVYVARSRVLKRIREELDGLVNVPPDADGLDSKSPAVTPAE